MSGGILNDLLEKLSKKTGREWTLADIMKLAEKLPEGEHKDIDSVLNELSGMGLSVSDEAKENVKKKLKDGKNLSLEDIGDFTKQVKGTWKKKVVKALGKKKKKQTLLDKIRKLQRGKRR